MIEAIEAMNFTRWHPHRFVPGPPVISINRVTGGFSDTLMADRCVTRADCRFLPGQAVEDVLADVGRVLDELRARDPELDVEVTVVRQAPALEVDPDEPIVGAMQRAIRTATERDLPLGGVGSTSDMLWMVNQLGISFCKFMFPTSETGTDEHESVADYLDTVRVNATLMLDLLEDHR